MSDFVQIDLVERVVSDFVHFDPVERVVSDFPKDLLGKFLGNFLLDFVWLAGTVGIYSQEKKVRIRKTPGGRFLPHVPRNGFEPNLGIRLSGDALGDFFKSAK